MSFVIYNSAVPNIAVSSSDGIETLGQTGFALVAESTTTLGFTAGAGLSLSEDKVLSLAPEGIVPEDLAIPPITSENSESGQFLLYTPETDSWNYEPFSSMVAGVSSVTATTPINASNTTGSVVLSIDDESIGTEKITDGAIAEAKVAEGAITETKLADLSVTIPKLAKLSLEEAETNDQALIFDSTNEEWKTGELVQSITTSTPSQLGVTKDTDTNSVTLAIEPSSISENFISNGAITSNKIQDLAVYSAKLGEKSVETAKLDDEAVTAEKLADASVSTEKLADASVTPSKLSAPDVQTSAFASMFTYVSNAWSSRRFKWTWNPIGGKLAQNEVDADGNILDDGVTLADITMNTFSNPENNTNAIKISGLNADATTEYDPNIERTAIYVDSGTSTLSSNTLPATLTLSNSLVDTSGGDDGGNLAAALDLRTSPFKFSNIKYFFPIQAQLDTPDTSAFEGKRLVVSEVKFDKDTTTQKYIPNLYFTLE
jgi:hypothetical protein